MPSAPDLRPGAVPREQLVAEIRDRLTRFGAPRLQLLLIVVLAGTAAFLASVAGLRLGVTSMAVRYPVATVAGYLTFIALLRAWIAWQRRSCPDSDLDQGLLDVDLDVPRFGRPGGSGDARFYAGGRSGGGGAAADLGGVEGDVYRRLHARDAAHWAVTTVRRTWRLAAILVLLAAIGGYAFDQAAPGARSIGGVVRTLASER